MEHGTLGYFGDMRLKKNGELLFKRIIAKRSVSLRKLGGNRATEVKFGRFLSNEKVTMNELTEESTKKTGQLASGHHVLALQDTTELNFEAHAGRVSGLGKVGNGIDAGLFLHPLLVLEAHSGACLGLGAIYTWMRHKTKSKNYQKQPIEEKESYRWLETALEGKKTLKEAALVTIIADRESDIYEEWCRIPDERTHLLTRACHNRKLANEEMLFEYAASLEVRGIKEIEVRERTKKRSAHKAKLEIRYGEIEIKRPKNCSDENAPESVKLTVVDVKELAETVIENEEPIHWRLLTTHEVKTYEDACNIVKWYAFRWNIEQLFRTLKKQGFQVESSQLETGTSLTKLAIIALRAAVQTMQLTLARSGKIDRPVSDVFTSEEVEVLNAMRPRLEGKTVKQKNPHSKENLSWAAWIIARLGGWNGYTSERPAGPITMLRGQIEFSSICKGWFMAKDVCIP
jgi:hypothetical protein